MKIFAYAEHWDGEFKKPSYEVVGMARELARKLGVEWEVLVVGRLQDEASALAELKKYGAARVKYVPSEQLQHFVLAPQAAAVRELIGETPNYIWLAPHTINGRALTARLAAVLDGGFAAAVLDIPEPEGDALIVRRGVFSGKGFAHVRVRGDRKFITVAPNAFGLREDPADDQHVERIEVEVPEEALQQVKITAVRKTAGKVSLTEAAIVVSGGRGLKGPENWGMIEELAEVLGAATACSKPVADMEWRPHHEHVGQTGLTISPDLYIAIGISGAIQHLAGVNGSKYIVVINKDPEAPFFQNCDYGIVGDAFEVVPRLIEAVRKAKES